MSSASCADSGVKNLQKNDDDVQTTDMELAFVILLKLGRQLDERSEEFTQEREQTIMHLIDGIKLLNKERRELHELLEVATITTSKRRYALATLPQQYDQDLKEAVEKARRDGEKQISEQRRQIEIALTDEGHAQTLIRELQEENRDILVEEARMQHRQTLDTLNQHIFDKAAGQIYLNETRETCEEVVKRTEEYEIACLNIAEDLQLHINRSHAARDRIVEEMEEYRKKLEAQNAVNAELEKSYEATKERMIALNVKFNHASKEKQGLDQSCLALESEKAKMRRFIVDKTKENDQLQHERDRLGGELEHLIEEYKEKVAEANRKNDEAFASHKNEMKSAEVLSEQKKKNTSKLVERSSVRAAVEKTTDIKTQEANEIRAKVNECERSVAAMRKRQSELESLLDASRTKHENFVDQSHKMIVKYGADLRSEKQLRAKELKQKEDSDMRLRDYRQHSSDYIEQLQDKIVTTKQNYKQSVEQTHELSRETRLRRRRNEEARVEAEQKMEESQRWREDRLEEVEVLLDRIDSLQQTNHTRNIKKQERELVLGGVRNSLARETEAYQVAKQSLISERGVERRKLQEREELTNKLQHLQHETDTTKRLLREQSELIEARLEEQERECRQSDQQIFNMISIGERINSRNADIVEMTQERGDEMRKIENWMSQHLTHNSPQLRHQLGQLKHHMLHVLRVSRDMNNDSAQKESVTQRELSELDEFLVGRREETSSVLGKMSDMLDDYTRFIEDLASRRPQHDDLRRKSSVAKRNKKKQKEEKIERAQVIINNNVALSTTAVS